MKTKTTDILLAILLLVCVASAQSTGPPGFSGPGGPTQVSIDAITVNGAAVPPNQACLGSNSASQLIPGTCGGGGGGSVMSVSLSMPSTFCNITGAPVTTTGTLVCTFSTGQAANMVFGTNGSGNVGLMNLTSAMIPTLSYLTPAHNLSDLSNAATARINLGLGTAATNNSGAFLQPSNNLGDVSSASTSRTNLGLGTAATQPTSAFQAPLSFSGTGTKTVTAVAAGASGNCAQWDTLGNVIDAGAPCGSGGGGLADPGSNGLVYRTALNMTAVATGAQVANAVATGPTNALACGSGFCDLVTALVPLKPNANTFSGLTTFTPGFIITPVAFASLPTCNGGAEGSHRTVTDSTTVTWGATITGGSTNHVGAYCDGSSWTVYAK